MNLIRSYRRAAVSWLALLPLIAACGARTENLSLLPADDMYSRAIAAYEIRDFERAITLLDFFVTQHLGDPRAPDARILLGDAHMERREYATAATHYQRLVNDFPLNPRSLEARFKTCEAYYRLSPRPALDQEFTRSALLHCQSVADYYPGTTEATQAAAYVVELENTLAEKLYDTGVHYFRRRAYDAAAVYFTAVVEQYPTTTFAPAALEQLVETYTRIGYVEDAQEARDRLLRDYPQSPQAQALRV